MQHKRRAYLYLKNQLELYAYSHSWTENIHKPAYFVHKTLNYWAYTNTYTYAHTRVHPQYIVDLRTIYVFIIIARFLSYSHSNVVFDF